MRALPVMAKQDVCRAVTSSLCRGHCGWWECVSTWEELSLHGGLARRCAKQAAVCCFFLASAHFAPFYPGWLARISYGHHNAACLNLRTYILLLHDLCQEQIKRSVQIWCVPLMGIIAEIELVIRRFNDQRKSKRSRITKKKVYLLIRMQ